VAQFIYTMYKVRKSHGDKAILDDVTLSFLPGAKIGVVGPNGAGKSTVLKIMAGLDHASNGDANLAPGASVGLLQQEPKLDESKTVRENVEDAVTTLRGWLTRFEEVSAAMGEPDADFDLLLGEQGDLMEKIEHAEGWDLDSRIEQAMDALRCPPGDESVTHLSGGERRRVALCKLLLEAPDLLLLDEPTNHLDVDAKTWLMGFLASYRGALLVVSHDLGLLDRSITRILHLDERDLIEYRGTYSQYRTQRKKDEERLTKVAARQQAEIKRLADLADSMRHSTEKRARKAQTLDSRVERLKSEAITGPRRERKVNFRFPEPPHSGRVSLVVEGLRKSYSGPPVFDDIGFDLGRGERLLVLGLNGAGKTSMLPLIPGPWTRQTKK